MMFMGDVRSDEMFTYRENLCVMSSLTNQLSRVEVWERKLKITFQLWF